MEKLLTVRIAEELHQKVKMSVAGQGTTMAHVVRTALEDYVAKFPPSKVKPKSEKAKPAKKAGKAKKSGASKGKKK